MIANPPHIVQILRWHHARSADPLATREATTTTLAKLLTQHIGPQPWDAFLRTYHLYLQAIPLEVAKEAWGINAARAAALTHRKA